jgi:hypothetical protein
MATIPDTLSAEMWALLNCANGALIEAGVPVGTAFLNPGLVVPDDDCCEGQLSVRVIQRFPSRTFPSIDTTASNCNPLFWSVELGVSVMRCAHTVDDDNSFPTGPEMTADALAINRDAALLETAIRCCWVPRGTEKKMIQQWTPRDTTGGCMGGEWTVFYAQVSCGCPEEHPLPVEPYDLPEPSVYTG